MSAGENKAVFLSYASQDADAAHRICEALRAVGVEVWFDAEGGLEHGDEWDGKIRRQIKDCVLFVPIISANTQARHEGYFRIEWELAAQRAMGIASGVPFILPVVIDDTREPEALVPDRFRVVQWTRLPGGVVPPEVTARFLKLWSQRTAILTTGSTESDVRGAGAIEPTAARSGRRPRRVAASITLVAIAAIAAMAGFSWWRAKDKPGAAKPGATASGATVSEAARLAEEARRHYTGIFTREDLPLAEEFGRRASDLDPQLARAWAVRAGANAAYLLRGFAQGTAAGQRAREAQSFANRALAIDRNDVEALLALGLVAAEQQAVEQAEAYYRRVLALEPNNSVAPRFLSIVLRRTGRAAEAVKVMKDAVRRAPGDALAHFDLGLSYAEGWNFAKAFAACEAAVKTQAFQGARVWQAWDAFQWKGDVPLMRSLIDQVDITHRSEEETVWVAMMCGLFERRGDRVREAAARTASSFLELWQLPKAWFTAQAFELDGGKENLARREWQAAEALLRERLDADPQNSGLRLALATALARRGRVEEARADVATVETLWREQMNPHRAERLAMFYAASGEAATAVTWLAKAVNQGSGIEALRPDDLRFNPWWDGIRDAPEFKAFLAHPPPAPAPVDD